MWPTKRGIIFGFHWYETPVPMIARIALLTFCAVFSLHLRGELLVADGILRTVGVDQSVVQLTVVPEFSEAYSVQQRNGRFVLELPYHAHYVLRAEGPGCATKEVVFNLNLPVRLNGLAREFPLEILMERMAEGATYHYSGPVGLVYFDEAREDFVYTTDHQRIYEHSNVVMTIHTNEGTPDDGAWAMGAVSPTPTGDPLAVRLPQLALGRSSVVAGKPTMAVADGTTRVGEATYQPAPPAVKMDENGTEASDGEATREGMQRPFEVQQDAPIVPEQNYNTPIEHHAPVAHAPAAAPTTTSAKATETVPYVVTSACQCGATERVQLPRCIVTIHHVSSGHGCAELRKAEHAYGAVFYFHEGRSITAHHYQQLLDTRASR